MHRLYWVGQLKPRRESHPRWLLFFHVDWAPEILETIKSVEISFGGHCVYPSYDRLRAWSCSDTYCIVPVALVTLEYVFNKLKCYAQDRRPTMTRPGTLPQVSDWSLDVTVNFLKRHPHRHYMSTVTIALLYIALPCFETPAVYPS